jgi:hypothetical protein
MLFDVVQLGGRRYWVPVIRCAVCNKTVDRVHAAQDFNLDAVRFKVECHGDVDYCTVTKLFIEQYGLPDEGVAFQTKRIEASHEP